MTLTYIYATLQPPRQPILDTNISSTHLFSSNDKSELLWQVAPGQEVRFYTKARVARNNAVRVRGLVTRASIRSSSPQTVLGPLQVVQAVSRYQVHLSSEEPPETSTPPLHGQVQLRVPCSIQYVTLPIGGPRSGRTELSCVILMSNCSRQGKAVAGSSTALLAGQRPCQSFPTSGYLYLLKDKKHAG